MKPDKQYRQKSNKASIYFNHLTRTNPIYTPVLDNSYRNQLIAFSYMATLRSFLLNTVLNDNSKLIQGLQSTPVLGYSLVALSFLTTRSNEINYIGAFDIIPSTHTISYRVYNGILSHLDRNHLSGNCNALLIYGLNLERKLISNFGRVNGSLAFIFTTVAPSYCMWFIEKLIHPYPFAIGISGVINTFVGASRTFITEPTKENTEKQTDEFDAADLLIKDVKDIVCVFSMSAQIILGIYEFTYLLNAVKNSKPNDGIAHAAHLEGYTLGLMCGIVFSSISKPKKYTSIYKMITANHFRLPSRMKGAAKNFKYIIKHPKSIYVRKLASATSSVFLTYYVCLCIEKKMEKQFIEWLITPRAEEKLFGRQPELFWYQNYMLPAPIANSYSFYKNKK